MASSKARKRRKRRARAAPRQRDRPHPRPRRRGRSPLRRKRPAARRATTSRRRRPGASFPLVELCVLAGDRDAVLGFFVVGGSRGPILIAAGLALGSIGGLELSIREHFAGYRSHTAVLAGVPALIVLGLLFYLGPSGLPQLARAAIGLAVFVGRGAAADPGCSAVARAAIATGSRRAASGSGAERASGPGPAATPPARALRPGPATGRTSAA